MILAELTALVEVISVMPAIRPNCRSSGVVTDVAMVSGSAPGMEAEAEMVGMSTRGMGDTGSRLNDTMPAMATPMVRRVVAIERLMKGVERFIVFLRFLFVSYAAISGSNEMPRNSRHVVFHHVSKRSR